MRISDKIMKKYIDKLYKIISNSNEYDIMNQSTTIQLLETPFNDVMKYNTNGIFLDLGCGLGNVMLLAKNILKQHKIYGVDNNLNYINFINEIKQTLYPHYLDI